MSNNSNKEIKEDQIPSRQNEDQTQRIAENEDQTQRIAEEQNQITDT